MDLPIIRVIVADEHFLFRQGIKALLASAAEIQVIEEAGSAAEAFELSHTHAPDLLLLDSALSGPELSLVNEIRQSRPHTRVLILCNPSSGPTLEQAAEAGAAGWLPRTSSALEIIQAIRESVPSASHAIINGRRVNNGSKTGETPRASLTPREHEVLRMLMQGGNSREIATALSLSIKTVEAHKFNLMRKLEVHSRGELIQLAIRQQIVSYVQHQEPIEKP